MDVLLANRQHLRLHWAPAHRNPDYKRSYRDEFENSTFGWRGPGATDEIIAERKKAWTKPPISEVINFYIRFEASATPELYKQIGDALSDIVDENSKVTVYPMKEVIHRRVIPELAEANLQAKRLVDAKNEEGRMLLDKLRELGFDVDEVENLTYATPEHHMEETHREIVVTHGGYNIGCTNKSQVYTWLHSHGILEETFPDWYAKGDF